MLPHKGTNLAIAFSGGIDSLVLAYHLAYNTNCEEIRLIACNYDQANWDRTLDLLSYHVKELRTRDLSRRVSILSCPITVTLPVWSISGGLFQNGFKPPSISPEDQFDYSKQERTYDYCLVDGRNAFLFLYMMSYCSYVAAPILFTGHQYNPLEWENIGSFRHRTEDFGSYFVDRMNLLQEVGFTNPVRLDAPFLSERLSKVDIVKLGQQYDVDFSKTYSCQFEPACGICDNCVCRQNTFKELGIEDE